MAEDFMKDSKERVALDLLKLIGEKEDSDPKAVRDRSYWIALYHHCYLAANGASPKEIFEKK
ncbi:hypothetical protein ED236_01800 [Pseudomethylobacillus aquaticus]|uniref:Uncharacterized protein n=1 Tax=Pseudomethylobacillus aquaticus TaxID=2676064 RepID=A0A3N0V763_9PROT|nr:MULTISPECIES: hypothetical protein [Methylophilaceae]ROH88228.1 hypothetical protein ED236_01800 [Pseudomethylobacillus aquaticus]